MKISTKLFLAVCVSFLFFSCKKEKKTDQVQTPTPTPPTEEYNYETLRIVAADITGAGTTFSFTGTPKAKVTYNGTVLDSMSLLVASLHYSVEPAGVCSYFDGSFTMNSKSFKIRKGVNNFLEFHDNTGIIGKWTINDNGTPYSSSSTGNPQTQVFCCGSAKDFGFAGK